MKLKFTLVKPNVIPFILGFTTMISLWSCESSKEKKIETSTFTVAVEKVQGSTGAEVYDYSGTLEADNTVNLPFSVSGRVLNIHVEEGQHVVKGTLLASLEADRYQSAYEIALANYTMASDNFKRNEDLYNRGSLPERDFIVAKSNLAQANANKELAAKDLSDTELRAPFTGIITNKITEVGAITAPGSPAFTLTKTDVMYATAAISESEIAHLSIGDSVTITVPALDKQLLGSVNILNPQADNYSRTFEVKVKLANEDGAILPGMLAQLHINTGEQKQYITVPTNSILKDTDNIAYVFLAQANKTAMKKRITIERATGMNKVIVSQGLKKGDLLIVKGQSKLYDGSAIAF